MTGLEENDVRRFVVNGTGNPLATNKSLKDMLDDLMGSGFATGTDALKIISDMLDTIRTELTFQHQADAVLSQASPASGTLYTVLDTTANVMIYGIFVKVTWTVQPTPLEIVVTIDGITLTYGVANPVSTQNYRPYWSFRTAALNKLIASDDGGTDASFGVPFIEGRSVKVEARTTGGTVSSLDCIVKYAKR